MYYVSPAFDTPVSRYVLHVYSSSFFCHNQSDQKNIGRKMPFDSESDFHIALFRVQQNSFPLTDDERAERNSLFHPAGILTMSAGLFFVT